MKQENNKDFEFKELITLKPLAINTVVLSVVAVSFWLYYFLMGINFKLYFVTITFGVIVLGITLILKAASSTIHISFIKDTLVVKINERINEYKKVDIIGLYSINYNFSKSSRVAFEILFDNGNSINISDFEFNDKNTYRKINN